MSRTTKVVLAVIVVVVLAGGGFLWWFFADDAPPEVSLQDATESVTTEPAAGPDGASAGADGDDLAGTWGVDTESGDFDFESATGTFAGFRIQEELSRIGSTTAVGRTGDVTGSMTIEGATVTAASFEIDLTTITTNESRRDSKVQSALETDTHPTASFELTDPIELGDAVVDGGPVSVVATGELTIHGVTQPVEFRLDAQLVDTTIVVVGSTEVVFSDYGVAVPSSPAVLSVEDHGTLEVQLLLTPA